MGLFATSEEWEKVIVGFFEKLFATPDVSARLIEADLSLRYKFSDPQLVLFLSSKDGNKDVNPGDEESKADVEMSMTAETAHKYWSGQINPMVAMASGKIKARGAVAKALKLIPMMGPAIKLYNGYLEENEAYRQYKL